MILSPTFVSHQDILPLISKAQVKCEDLTIIENVKVTIVVEEVSCSFKDTESMFRKSAVHPKTPFHSLYIHFKGKMAREKINKIVHQ